jgi:hypothetical protein
MKVASSICVYTNDNYTIEIVDDKSGGKRGGDAAATTSDDKVKP